jgi:hypothetical protein
VRGQQQLDGLGFAGVVGIPDEPPEPRLAQAGLLVLAGVIEAPGPGFPIQVVAAVVRDDDLLAESVVAVRSAALAFAAPHADEGQQRQQRVVEVGALAQVRGVGRKRQVVEGGDVAGGGELRAFGGGSHRSVAGARRTHRCVGVLGGHDSSVMSR